MNKKSILANLAFASLLFGACAENANTPAPTEVEKTNLIVNLNFEGAGAKPKTRAVGSSTAIPETSWNNIKDVQFFLYKAATNGDSLVVYSKKVTGLTGAAIALADIPTGSYKLVAIANVNSSSTAYNIATFLDGGVTPEGWTDWNVRQKNAKNLLIKYKAGTFPTFYNGKLSANAAYMEPSEIFKGSAENVTIGSGTTAAVTDFKLKREVSLMRVRLNSSAQNDVDFTKDASILIYRLPKDMNVSTGRNPMSVATDVLSISGTDLFKTADPVSGYSPLKIIDETTGFTKWRDINVFPNVVGDAAAIDVAHKYFIVVSGQGPVGHVMANGQKLMTAGPVFWSGVINDPFKASEIREVNLTLRTGGSSEPVTEPTEEGNLTINVSPPVGWASNIVSTDITL